MNNWIEKAHIKKGSLHRELGLKEGKKIPHALLLTTAKRGGLIGKRARLALTLGHFTK